MSRSHKHVPICKVTRHWSQGQANRCIRQISMQQKLTNGSSYKRYYPMWDVIDQRYYESYNQWRKNAIANLTQPHRYKSYYRTIEHGWCKAYYMK